MLLFNDMVYMLVRYASPGGHMCLRCLMLTLSGPVRVVVFAAWTCVVVSDMLVVCSLSVFLSMCLFVLCVLCLTVVVNCLLNVFAICVDCVGVLLASPCIVFQRVCVCDPSVCLGVPSICQICVFVCMRDHLRCVI